MINSRTQRTLSLFIIATMMACGGARAVTKNAERHRLNNRPGGRVDGYAITYDARARGAYLLAQRDAKSLLKLCAEPPPDVAANLGVESEFEAELKALLKFKAVDASLDAAATGSTNATSEIANAATRTELVLVMRDALYRICEMNANGNLSAEQAAGSFETLIQLARNLGQRDNVAKLIEVVRIAFETKPPQDPDLAREYVLALGNVLRTVTLLAASDQLAQQGSEVSGIVQQTVNKQLMENLVGAAETDDRIAKRLGEVEEQLTSRREKIDALQAVTRPSKSQIQELKDLRAEAQVLQMRAEELRAVQ